MFAHDLPLSYVCDISLVMQHGYVGTHCNILPSASPNVVFDIFSLSGKSANRWCLI